tara:strand:+ start:144 stop:410 length:267 start_codon:yes stop_codon:yes gene_type:complete
MTKRELRELIRGTIKEFTGTGAGGGGHNPTDGNNVTSQRMGGGSFKTDEDEIEFYNGQNAGEGGQGLQTRGMEKRGMINPDSQKQVRF